MQPRTYLSFWHIELSNLPVGSFRRRVLPLVKARSIVNSARASGTLLCVAKEDLAAPYCEGERQRHKQLSAALRKHAGIDIHLNDFLGDDFANPLSFAEVGNERTLLVVDCHYAVDDETRLDTTAADSLGTDKPSKMRALPTTIEPTRMIVVPDSIQFYIFEHIDSATT